MDLLQSGPDSFDYPHNNQIQFCSFSDKKKCPIRDLRGFSHAKLNVTDFELVDVAAGLPESEAMFDALLHPKGRIAVPPFSRLIVSVGVRGGIESGATNLFAKKMATLVMVLEESLILKLVAPPNDKPRGVRSVLEKSKAAQGLQPQDGAKSSDYESHVPPMAAIEPAAWDNGDLERMYRMISMIWSAPSLRELQDMLCYLPSYLVYKDCVPCMRDKSSCDFYLALEDSEGLWDPEENPWGFACRRDPENVFPDPEAPFKIPQSFELKKNPEEWCSFFCFKYLRTTFEHTLFRNWVEVIARIVELAMAGPDEYRGCLEAIFRIQYSAHQGSVAWEQLMEHVLKLGHRIQDWRDQVARYERGEMIAGHPKIGYIRFLGK